MENPTNLPSTATATTHQPHVAVCPSVGMCHLTPFLCLASTLSSFPYNCRVTLVIIVPTVSAAESDQISAFFCSHPHIHRLDFHIDSPVPTAGDPFLFRYVTVSRSAHLLTPHLSALSPPLSAVFSDFMLTKGLNSTLPHLPLPNYTVIITSARFFSLMAYLPHLVKSLPQPGKPAQLPGLAPFPSSNIPPPFFDPDHKFTTLTTSNAQCLPLSKGILINTFEGFEPETFSAFRGGGFLSDLPPVCGIGPHHPLISNNNGVRDDLLSWLDEQPEKSVVYMAFGSRTALSREQLREVGWGLERSGWRFVWVVKFSIVDREEKEGLEGLLGQELYERLEGKGKVVKRWVSQEEVLAHRAVGGFVSHSGWSSVMEAARCGVPMLAWPQNGDQRGNAEVVQKVGLGVWESAWGWQGGGGKVVEATEVAEKVKAVMEMEELRRSARRIRQEAERAREAGGSSMESLMSIVESLKKCN